MKTLGNLIWLICGGLLAAIEYLLASLLMMITIIGIPVGLQTLNLAGLMLWPFGRRVVDHGGSSGCLSVIMNILWLFFGGLSICLTHLFFGILLCLTLIGIPFGKQHFKLAGLALTPFGKHVV